MIIANGVILDDEKVFAALRSAALIPDDSRNGNIVVATEIPEGLLCAGVDGELGIQAFMLTWWMPQKSHPRDGTHTGSSCLSQRGRTRPKTVLLTRMTRPFVLASMPTSLTMSIHKRSCTQTWGLHSKIHEFKSKEPEGSFLLLPRCAGRVLLRKVDESVKVCYNMHISK